MEGLLDHQEPEILHRAEHVRVGGRVRGVRVDRQPDVRVGGSHGAHAIEVRARLDLQLDPPVALREVALDLLQEHFGRRRDPDAHTAFDPAAIGPEPGGERCPLRSELRVHEGVQQCGLRHRVPPDLDERRLHARHVDVAGPEERGNEELPEHEPGALVELTAEVGRVSATHSPQPSASSVSTRTITQRFSATSPKLVRNGRTRGSRRGAARRSGPWSRVPPGQERVGGPGSVEGPHDQPRPEARLERFGGGIAPA